LGTSLFQETRFAGVWLITHYNANQEVLGKFIEITQLPSLLKSPREDLLTGLKKLEHQLHGESLS